MHPFLQPQRSNYRQACVASGRVVQHIFQPPFSFLFHPHALGDESSGVAPLLYFFGISHIASTLRSSVSKQVFIVIANLDIGKHALSVVASTICNQFPITIKSENIPIFCQISQNIFD